MKMLHSLNILRTISSFDFIRYSSGVDFTIFQLLEVEVKQVAYIL